MSHKEIWVKVNAPVDEGIAPIVTLLSEVEGLETLESCQGDSVDEAPAFVFFRFKDWETICRFAFEVVSPALARLDADTSVSVDVFNRGEPMGKIQIRSPESIPAIANALRGAIR